MLNYIVGNIDYPAAAVLIVAFITACIFASTLVVNYQSRQEIANKHELAMLAQSAETAIRTAAQKSSHDEELARIGLKREVEFRRIDHGMLEGTKVVRGSDEG